MCNPALIGLGLMAVGTASTYMGQRKGAKAALGVARREEEYQRKLRMKSLADASATADQASPQALAASIAAPQATVGAEQGNAAAIAKAALQTGAPGAVGGEIYDAAQADAARAVAPMATRQGFAQGIQDQGINLEQLAQNNLFLGEDSRRSASTLGRRIARAGRKGSGLRLVGQVANIAGGAVTGGALYGPAATAVGGKVLADTGEGRLSRGRGGRQTER